MRRVTRCLVARFDGLAISSTHTVCGYTDVYYPYIVRPRSRDRETRESMIS